MAARAASRKRPSAPVESPGDPPAAQRRRKGPAGGTEAPATLVDVAPADGSAWLLALQRPREEGKCLDITLVARGRAIPAHKVAILAHSPYVDGLLTSGLAESVAGSDEVSIDADGAAVESVVDCIYSGKLSLSAATVSSVIRTANLLQVSAVEQAACEFFVQALEPATALDALGFAAQRRECGEHARRLHEQCLAYVVVHFEECARCPTFAELPSETVCTLLSSDDLPVGEPVVLSALRVWVAHDVERRKSALKDLVPLVRWPLLPEEAQLGLASEPLLLQMMEQGREALALGVQLLIECRSKFSRSAAAAACLRLKWRKGTAPSLRSLAFTEVSAHYQVSEEGARVTANTEPLYSVARCGDVVMSSGKSCAEFTIHVADVQLIGLARPTLNVNHPRAWWSTAFWGMGSAQGSGCLFHHHKARPWQGQQGFAAGDVVRMLLDLDAGTLTVKKNGQLLGVMVTGDQPRVGSLTGEVCWAMTSGSVGDSVSIAAVNPNDF